MFTSLEIDPNYPDIIVINRTDLTYFVSSINKPFFKANLIKNLIINLFWKVLANIDLNPANDIPGKPLENLHLDIKHILKDFVEIVLDLIKRYEISNSVSTSSSTVSNV